VDAYRDRVFTGKVSQIRLTPASMQNVVTYGVVVDVDNTDGTLLPYMTAKLQFEVAHREQVILVPNQALRWRPAWDEVSPTARAGLTPPEPGKAREETDEETPTEDDEPRLEVVEPTVWILAQDGFVRPVKVQVGLSDGMHTEVTGGKLQPADKPWSSMCSTRRSPILSPASFPRSPNARNSTAGVSFPVQAVPSDTTPLSPSRLTSRGGEPRGEATSMPLIELQRIDKNYRLGDVDLPVLKQVSLTIERGEFVALMGASGSGKTTLMNLLGCLDRPTAGSYAL
jgi:ABC-type multidrug transport system fused ATPase/permease subunit